MFVEGPTTRQTSNCHVTLDIVSTNGRCGTQTSRLTILAQLVGSLPNQSNNFPSSRIVGLLISICVLCRPLGFDVFGAGPTDLRINKNLFYEGFARGISKREVHGSILKLCFCWWLTSGEMEFNFVLVIVIGFSINLASHKIKV